MGKNVLVTGGAGFIGTHLVEQLILDGHQVTVLDSLEKQVHGEGLNYLNPSVKFVKGNVLDKKIVTELVKDSQVVFHLAASVGVGQSQYKIRHYVKNNILGTANLLDVLANTRNSVEKIIVAGSMSSYGEGKYVQSVPVPTPETKLFEASSIYAITKKVQEEMAHTVGRSYGIPVVALRYFNVFGKGQSLNNPYTGVIAIFLNQIKNKQELTIYEDGLQSRDFTSVKDVVAANILAMKSKKANYESFNVGTGKPTTILGIARLLLRLTKSNLQAKASFKSRQGDIRHCFADISKIKKLLGFKPKTVLVRDLKELIEWSDSVKVKNNSFKATKELFKKGLVK